MNNIYILYISYNMRISQNLSNFYRPLKLCDVNTAQMLSLNMSSITTDRLGWPGKKDDAPKEACLNFGHQCFKCLYFKRPKKTRIKKIRKNNCRKQIIYLLTLWYDMICLILMYKIQSILFLNFVFR